MAKRPTARRKVYGHFIIINSYLSISVVVAIYRFNLILTVAVVETMTMLPASEAIQLIRFTLQDSRVQLLPLTPQDVSFSGFQDKLNSYT